MIGVGRRVTGVWGDSGGPFHHHEFLFLSVSRNRLGKENPLKPPEPPPDPRRTRHPATRCPSGGLWAVRRPRASPCRTEFPAKHTGAPEAARGAHRARAAAWCGRCRAIQRQHTPRRRGSTLVAGARYDASAVSGANSTGCIFHPPGALSGSGVLAMSGTDVRKQLPPVAGGKPGAARGAATVAADANTCCQRCSHGA